MGVNTLEKEGGIMDLNDVRAKIQRALEYEERTDHAAQQLRKHIGPNGEKLNAKQVEECLKFATCYINDTPNIMDAVFVASREAGILPAMQPMFDTAFSYWAEQHDFIPDHLGLLGLADDAYLSLLFMETISKRHADSTGSALLSVDLGPPNRLMRHLIGEPIASHLDMIVMQATGNLAIQQGLQQLQALGAGLHLNMPSYNNDYASIEEEARVRLGAMGVL